MAYAVTRSEAFYRMPTENPAENIEPKALVQKMHPDAFANDDEGWVYIHNKQEVTEPCPHCGQTWKHKVIDFAAVFGSGPTESAAWKDAAKALGLMPLESR